MKPFQHVSAADLDEAVKAGGEKARIIAGGTDCLSLLKNRVHPEYPEVLVNIKTIPGLDDICEDDEGLTVGALATLAAIAASPAVRAGYGVLAEAANAVGSPQIRNMGTLGGNLCQEVRCLYYRSSPLSGRAYLCLRKGGKTCFAVAGDNRYHAILGGKGCFAVCPSDIAVALLALDAIVAVRGASGERQIRLEDFTTTLGTVLKPQEIVTGIRVPGPLNGNRQRFLKFRLRKAVDFAIVSVAAVITVEDGTCRDAVIALGGVAPTPLRARAAEEAIKGKRINAVTAAEAARQAVAGAAPLSMNAYKVEITKALIKRALLV